VLPYVAVWQDASKQARRGISKSTKSVALCCSVLQCVAVCCSVAGYLAAGMEMYLEINKVDILTSQPLSTFAVCNWTTELTFVACCSVLQSCCSLVAVYRVADY